MRTAADIRSELFKAIENGDVEESRRLLKEDGANLDYADLGWVLRRAAFRGHADIAELALDHGADVHHEGEQTLFLALKFGHLDTARLLLDKGADAVAAAGRAQTKERAAVIGRLNEVVGNIPRDQWQALLSLYEGDLPALVAAEAAEQRRVSRLPPSA